MKMKKTLLLSTLATVLLFSGCKKDYLETAPTDKVGQENIFTSTANANTAINGVYRFMFERTTVTTSNVQNKPGVGGILLSMDFMGEDLGISAGNWFTSTGEGNWVAHRADNHQVNYFVYRTFYKIIGNLNFIIDNIDNVTGTPAEIARIKSEALTTRAYCYSYLVQLYGKRYDASAKPNAQLGVPLLLSSNDSAKPRETVEVIYQAIIKDLEDAIALNTATRSNKSQANVDVALGLRARVALTMQDYPNAILYAKKVIDENKYPLMNQEVYVKGFNDASAMSEVMWAAMPSADQGDAFGSWFAQIAYNANTSYMRANPKRINSVLYDQISVTDVRKKMWEPKPTAANFPLPTTAFARQDYMSRKFSIKADGGTLGDVTYIRSAEMHLILAEAYAKSNQTSLAQQALFKLVQARDASATITSKTGTDLINEILTNRRVELWGEGFRFLDLKRLNQPLNRTAVPNYVSASVGDLMDVPAGDPRWQFLIPRSEMESNPNIGSQNP